MGTITRGVQPEMVQRLKEALGLKRLIGESPAFVEQIQKLPAVARCDAGVLISGETGTGKELIARAIHYLSPRASGPFIPVNSGAIPVDLLENELFGHERSAFTGAQTARPGLIEEADGGTLFLDEVDSLPPLAQVKLLRFLQEKEFRRLGSTRVQKSDVRVIAATNADVEAAVAQGKIRRDLYYRLNVIPVVLPPLRERREDIPLLANHFLRRYAEELGQACRDLTAEAMQVLQEYNWPGNVRELEHVIERAVVLSGDRPQIEAEAIDLPRSSPRPALPRSFQEAKALAVARFERSYLEELLALYRGNISRAARAAQKNRRALWELIRKHAIDARRYRSPES